MDVFTPQAQRFRLYADGTESGSSPLANENTNYTTASLSGDYQFHLRYMVQNTTAAGGAASDDYALQYSRNSGAWTRVTASSSYVRTDTASSLTDGSATTNRATNGITDGTGSFQAGIQEEGDGEITNFTHNASTYVEHVYALKIVYADVVNGDTLDFRMTLNAGAPGMTNSYTPRVTVTKPVAYTKELTEAATLTDTVTPRPGFVRPSEVLGLSDTIVLPTAGDVVLRDPGDFADVDLGGTADTAKYKTLTDQATLTDSLREVMGTSQLSAAASLADTIAKSIGIALLEVLTLSDPTVTTARQRAKELTETVTLADTLERAITRTRTESITTTDTLANCSNWAHPSYYGSSVGATVSGVLSDTWRSDATSLVLSETAGTPGFDHQFAFGPYLGANAPQVPTSQVLLTLVGQYSGNAGHTVQVQQWDFVGAGWVDTGGRIPDSASETTYRIYLSTESKYRNASGISRVRFYHTSPGNITHQLIINELFLSYRFDGTESATLTDTLTAKKGTLQGTETLSLADSLTKAANYQRTLTEGVSLTDTWTKASAAARTLEEQLYANDLELLQASITLYESASLADSPKKDWARTLTEGLTLSDTLSAALRNVTLTETLGLADTASKGPARTWTEGATLTATPTKGPGRTLSDAATVADGTLKRTAQGIRNDITLADSMGSRPVTRTLTETAVLTDSVQNEWSGGANNYTKDLTENLLLSDVFDRTWTAARSYTEGATLVDSATKGPGRTLSEGVTLSDSLVRLATAQRTLEEQLWANDLELLQASITLKETLGLTATFERQAGRSRTITNYLYLSDAGLRVTDLGRADVATLSDAVSKDASRTLNQAGSWWDGFESGDLSSQWTTVYNPDGTLTTPTTNPGSGARSAYINTKAGWPSGDIWLDKTGIGGGRNARISLWFYGVTGSTDPDSDSEIWGLNGRAAILYHKITGGQWRFWLRGYKDDLNYQVTSTYDYPLEAWHHVEVLLTTADPGQNNGSAELRINGVTKETLTGLDNDSVAADVDNLQLWFAYSSGVEYYVDDVEVTWDSNSLLLRDTRTLAVARSVSDQATLTDSINNVHTPGTTGYTKELTETAVLSGTVKKDTARSLTEGVALLDTRTGSQARALTESLGLADSPRKDTARIWTEGVTLAGTGTKSPARTLTETAALTDTFSRQVNYQRTFTESAGLLDSLSQGNSETILNGVALTDTLTLQSNRYRTFTETATLADTIQKATGRTATELLTLTDSRGVSSLARTLSEQVTLTDQASKHSARSINEIAYLTDSLDVSIGAAKVESLALTDSVRKDIARTLVETAGLVDLVNTGNSQTFLAGVTLADTVSKSASRTLTEGLTLLDTKVSGDQIDFEDPVSLAASLTKSVGRVLLEGVGLQASLTTQANFSQIQSDVVVLSDTLETQFSGANHYTKELTEAATLIDSVSKAASRSLIEGVTLSDTHWEDAARIHAEGLGLADTLTVESAGARLLTDRVTLSDSLTTQRRAINLLEQVVLGDVLQANRFVSKTLTEKITLRHNPNSFGTSQPPNKGVGRTLAEGITVKDSWVHHKYETLVLTDTLERLRTHVLYQTPTLIDTLEVGYGDSSSQEDVVLVDEVRKDVARELTEGITVRTAALAPDIYTEEQVLMFAG